ncbi:MAG: transcription-repair coupling factor [Rectinema sp.]|nr:transcription-repair coupling factor [Rectinema sp.]
MKLDASQALMERLSRQRALGLIADRIKEDKLPVYLQNSENTLLALDLAILAKRTGKRFIVVLHSETEVEEFASDLATAKTDVLIFPSWAGAPYRPLPERSRMFGDRASALVSLARGEYQIAAVSARTLAVPVPPPDYVAQNILVLEKGQIFDPIAVAEKLSSWGYLRVPSISLPGEYALRGEVLDLFMPGDQAAVRIHFDFDKINRISSFDPVSQSGHETRLQAVLRPLREVIWDSATLRSVRKNIKEIAGSEEQSEHILEKLEAGVRFPGEEFWFPLAFEHRYSLAEYADDRTVLVFAASERIEALAETLRKEYASFYRIAQKENLVPPPDRILCNIATLRSETRNALLCFALKGEEKAQERIALGAEAPRSYFGNIRLFKEELEGFKNDGYLTWIAAFTKPQAERIASLITDESVSVLEGPFSSGFILPELRLRLVSEHELFGHRKHVPRSLGHARSQVIDSFIELSPGDYVVHVNYGIGKFTGIERITVLGLERDYIRIEYAGEEKVFVPIEQANLVQRYIGNEGEAPRLDSLGSKSWENRKKRVSKSVEELAERLIRIYARRKTAKGFAFPPDTDWQLQFEASFPYEETEDQIRCIEEVKRDMESPRPMDRLVCGDVGFGKTEIAMRACFKAICAGKQVAFLAPTTILAEQHYENFMERASDFPIRVALLSRMIDRKTQTKILKGLEDGSIDMVIGTHRILQKDVRFKDLGFLVIDEEQRFGVKDKERLKEMKAGIDCLTLTATPIPRTLHMSLLKIRDMSVLKTPPLERQPIQTIVEEFSPQIVAGAIRNEIARGGQIFYLHNRIETLPEVEIFIRQLVPEALVESAHGQMDARDLEAVMHRFIHGAFHVLVSTTIIENGIDIPNVNTIIIDRADNYGVSQLYQLKGRVGRSDRQAYAYLLYPDRRALSELAMKRLQIISDFTELGSGFKIALKDLEVRGAGNLLGREQSGDIYAVGFDLYLKLLDEAVSRLSGLEEAEEEPYLELEYSGFIPDHYISHPMIKMEIYKRIASVSCQEEIDSLHEEMEERFGPIPEEALSLLALAEMRVLCRRLSISSLRERGGVVTIEFSKVSKISVEKLLRLIRESSGAIRLDPSKPNAIQVMTRAIGLKEKSAYLKERLSFLAG